LKVPIDSIFPNDFNPNELDEAKFKSLVDNISKNGQQYPIIINSDGMIIDGEQRWKALKRLGFKEVEVEVRDLDRIGCMTLNYQLNKDRGTLNPFKEAEMFKELLDKGYSTRKLASLFNVDHSHIVHRISLLNITPDLRSGDTCHQLTPSHWELISPLNPSTQRRLVKEIIESNLSVRETERITKFYKTLDMIPIEYRSLLQQIRKIRRGTTPHKPDIWFIPNDFTFFFVCEYLDMTKGHWNLFPVKNFLISAYHFLHKGTLRFALAKRDLLSVIAFRDEIENLLLDSGMIAALRRKDLDYLRRAKDIINLAEIIRADIIVHLDVNMEPTFLRENSLSPKVAMEYTIRNAEILLNENCSSRKCFVIQGWTLDQYNECIEKFDDMGILDENHWIGIGTTCMRRPPDLYQVYDFCLKKIQEINPKIHVHAFGIAKPEWIVSLYKIGVRSSDSATPDLACAFNQFITDKGEKVRIFKERTREMYASQVIYNYWAFFLLLNN